MGPSSPSGAPPCSEQGCAPVGDGVQAGTSHAGPVFSRDTTGRHQSNRAGGKMFPSLSLPGKKLSLDEESWPWPVGRGPKRKAPGLLLVQGSGSVSGIFHAQVSTSGKN